MKATIREGFGGAGHKGKRVPTGEPGFVFYRSHKQCMPPLQKGDKLQNPREHSVEIEEDELPRWLKGGDYVVHAVTVTEDMKEPRDDHVVLALRQGHPHAWLIQSGDLFVREEAMRLMQDFDWNKITPEGPAMVASRVMAVASSGEFPEVDWILVSRVKGREEKVYGSSPAYRDLVMNVLQRVNAEN